MTKYHKLGGLNNENVSSHSPGGQKSRVEVSSGVTLSEAVACLSPSFGRYLVLLALQARQRDPGLHLHMVHSVSVSVCQSLCSGFPHVLRMLDILDYGSTLKTSF